MLDLQDVTNEACLFLDAEVSITYFPKLIIGSNNLFIKTHEKDHETDCRTWRNNEEEISV
jgi:hypothetical protein